MTNCYLYKVFCNERMLNKAFVHGIRFCYKMLNKAIIHEIRFCYKMPNKAFVHEKHFCYKKCRMKHLNMKNLYLYNAFEHKTFFRHFLHEKFLFVIKYGVKHFVHEKRLSVITYEINSFFADCSRLNLKVVPSFNRNVLKIDLSHNEITEVSANIFPIDIEYIDVSFNKINRFQNGSFNGLSKLRTLLLQANKLHLNDEIYFTGLFQGLKQLTFLNIKNNSKPGGYKSYPIEITNLQSLEILYVDGFDKPFSKEYTSLRNLKTLSLSGVDGICSIYLLEKNHFQNLPYLTNLDISSCELLRIEKGTFQHLVYLQYLDISFNVDLSFRVLSNVTFDLQFTKISVFKGNKIYNTFGVGSVLFKEDIKYIANTTLTEIYLDSNRLQIIESGTLGFVPDTLRYISVADNQFTMGWYVLEIAQLKYVTEINSSFQHIAHNPRNIFIELIHRNRSCDQFVRYPCEGSISEKDDRFNQNEFLDMIENFSALPFYPVPPSLERAHFRRGDLWYKIPRLKFTTNVIKYIDFSWNILYEWEGPILNVGKVEYLDISNNYCSKVSKFFFQDFKNLTKLLIGGNILGYTLNTDKNGEIFSNLQSLKYLDISNNYIFYLSSKIFVGLKQLQFLNMSNNNLREWNFDISHMSNLKFIDMSHNQLTDIPLTMRQSLDRISLYRNISLDLTDNNFFCACPNIEFLKWLLGSKISFKHSDRYTCQLSNGTLINFANLRNYFVEFELKCSSKAGLIAGVSSAIFVSIVFIIVGVVYRYRWKLRYLYYMTKSKYRGYTSIRTPDQDGEYEFDAFVSYADSDRKFVLEDVINNLEKEGGCRLCVHHRDFIPGLDIADNITSSIHESNKTILILSPDFLKSYWCMFEFNMARMESIYSRDGRNVLFLVFYKNVSGKDLPLVMLDLIESQSYIEYPNDPQGDVVFWDKIREALSLKINFNRDVFKIDLSHNEITEVPANIFPTDIEYIDISFNKINRFQNGSFNRLSKLRTLLLQANKLHLNDEIYFTGLFEGLKQLTFLNIKNNSKPGGYKSYPIEITNLQSLEILYVDGFDKPFSKEYTSLHNLKTLSLSGLDGKCSIYLLQKNHFQNLPYLTNLDISSCKLLRIEKGTFQHLAYLQFLDISFNADLSFRVLSNVSYDLQFTNISVFKGNSIHYTFGKSTELYTEDIKHIRNTSLKQLYLDKNRLGLMEINALENIPDTVEYLSAADNKLTMGWYVLQTEVIKGVKEYNGSFQHTAHNPYDLGKSIFHRERGCDNERRSTCEGSIPKYKTEQMLALDMYLQNILKMNLPVPICKSVEKIHFSQCSLKYQIPQLTMSENNITYVDLSGNILYEWTGPVLNVHKIQYLDLSNNYCSSVSDVFFQDLKNLKTLNVSSNILGYTLNTDKEGKKLGHLKALKQLDLSRNYIFSLSSRIFVGLQQLEHLNLSRNNLRDLLICHIIRLFGIQENIRHSLDSISVSNNITLDFTGNNFMCTCNDLEFMKWFLNSKIIFRNFENYACRFQNGTIFSFEFLKDTILIMERDCSSKVGLIAGLSAAIFVVITVIVGGIIYRYRWKLRYLYYMTKSTYWGYSQIGHSDGEYEFDAFVSYADSDRKFVLEDVISNLEKDGGCRLCVHHRDFTPGLDIADNITSSIHKSNKTILILSPDFLKSYWCMFEFNMARMESIYSRDGRNVLFLVFYKNVSGKDLPLVMLDLIESQSYIEYPNDPQGNVVFWDKIKESISVQ
ncbi:hypothetical protein KUTeg_021135 [Tegillarca granosa]|uniref:TIR domain-containing protein n=1 Tax=Tegillarca granosa TaxID=220873 RepID=A0ABQ9E9X3_TEGGR|nr:hypothetical protein KUTeg_021135 [Tegillarca granosa]